MQKIVVYWSGINELIRNLFSTQPRTIQEGFWPNTNWKRDYKALESNFAYVGDQLL